jgi:hypothetical protein
LGRYDWQVTPVGERIMAGDGPWYVTQVEWVETAHPQSGPVELKGSAC